MSINPTVSFLSESTSQANRLIDLRSTLDNLERQATTQKKYENYAGFGANAFSLQRLHDQAPITQSWLDNLGTVSNRMQLMSQALTQITSQANNVVNAVNIGSTDPAGAASIQQQAKNALDFIEELLNQQADGHYLFAGSNVTSQPFVDNNTLQTNVQNQVTQWLNGTITNNQLSNAVTGLSATNLGLSNSLATAGVVTARVDQSTDIDYTFKADQPGVQDIIRALTLLENMPLPNPATDVATTAQYNSMISYAQTTLNSGINSLNGAAQQVAGTFNLVKTLTDVHNNDLQVINSQINTAENADQTDVLSQMSILQTQLTASYQVTKIVNSLSLTNFL